MKKHIISLTLLTLTVLLIPQLSKPAFAQEKVTVDGLTFNVEKVAYGQWAKPRHHLVNDMVAHTNDEEGPLGYIAISYILTNTNSTKKIDLDGKFDYRLFDDFGNRYRPMRKPENYNSSVLIVSKNFPSLFPGEKYGETLFFEAPIDTAKNLKLSINIERIRLSRPVELTITPEGKSEKQPHATDLVNTAAQVSEAQPAEGPAIKISSPLPGIILHQGESVPVKVEYPGQLLPKKIIVIALDNTFEDNSPRKEGIYNINVPSDQAPETYIVNVIAQWPNGDLSSAVLEFKVKELPPPG
jgi:hypothetical protein